MKHRADLKVVIGLLVQESLILATEINQDLATYTHIMQMIALEAMFLIRVRRH